MTKDIMPAKDVCDHSRENNKAIQRQFKKKTKLNRWTIVPYLWTGKFNIVKILILPGI